MADIYSSVTTLPPYKIRDNINRRRLLELLRTQLENERASFISHWKDIADFMLPRRVRLTTYDTDRGDKRNLKIIDGTATLAIRTLRAGMLSGIMSPARPWFALRTGNDALDEDAAVRGWCASVTDRLLKIFQRSNVYTNASILFGDLGTFGTGCLVVEEDFTGRVINTIPMPLGTFGIGNFHDQRVSIFMRQFRITVSQLMKKFAKMDENGKILDDGNLSTVVKNLWENGNTQAWVDCIHFIVPRQMFNPGKSVIQNKPFYSVYYEYGVTSTSSTNYMSPADPGRFLSEGGYDLFPVLAGRWETAADDIYGTDCPGMTALPDVRTLQMAEKRSWQAVEKIVNPPMVAPGSLRNTKASILPGDITYVDEREGQRGFRSAHDINFSIAEVENKENQIRARIQRAFFEDLFMMLANDDSKQPDTATEIVEKKQEKLIALGPILTQFNKDVLDPLIQITFNFAMRQGLIPPPPPQMAGQPLHIEYVSILAQAMKVAGIGNLERFGSFVGQVVAQTGDPSHLDKVNFDKMIEIYGSDLSLPPQIMRTDAQAAALKAQRQKQAQAAAVAQNAGQMAGAVKDLANARTNQPSALSALMGESQAGQVVPS